jgi:small subunit ribosomal protein S6
MREYETTFIVQPEISDEGCQELLARIDGILEREGAIRLLHDDQGKRKLAYEIRKFQKGRYVTTHYLDHGKAVAPLERTLRLEEAVLRFLTVQVTDQVEDIEQRKLAAAEEERIRAERARERAAREAEEEKARQEAARLAGEAHAARSDADDDDKDDDKDDDEDDDERDDEEKDEEDSDYQDSEDENGGDR